MTIFVHFTFLLPFRFFSSFHLYLFSNVNDSSLLFIILHYFTNNFIFFLYYLKEFIWFGLGSNYQRQFRVVLLTIKKSSPIVRLLFMLALHTLLGGMNFFPEWMHLSNSLCLFEEILFFFLILHLGTKQKTTILRRESVWSYLFWRICLLVGHWRKIFLAEAEF